MSKAHVKARALRCTQRRSRDQARVHSPLMQSRPKQHSAEELHAPRFTQPPRWHRPRPLQTPTQHSPVTLVQDSPGQRSFGLHRAISSHVNRVAFPLHLWHSPGPSMARQYWQCGQSVVDAHRRAATAAVPFAAASRPPARAASTWRRGAAATERETASKREAFMAGSLRREGDGGISEGGGPGPRHTGHHPSYAQRVRRASLK
jgi:hypothetical protein